MNTTTDSVRLAIFNRDNPIEFLILAEADDPTNMKLPGGKFNTEDETPGEAMAREAHEELNADAEKIGIREAGKLVNDDGVSARFIFAASVQKDDIIPSAEIALTKWVDEDHIPDGPNKAHILSAVRLARTALNN